MKLTCDLCGGTLEMTSGGQSAVCTNCGISYSIERLREKLGSRSTADGSSAGKPQYTPPVNNYVAPTRYLRIKRKSDLFMCKAAVILDGQQCAMLGGWGKETVLPVSCGTHTVSIQAASAAGVVQTNALTIQVADRDWQGIFGLERGALKASYKFDLWEVN